MSTEQKKETSLFKLIGAIASDLKAKSYKIGVGVANVSVKALKAVGFSDKAARKTAGVAGVIVGGAAALGSVYIGAFVPFLGVIASGFALNALTAAAGFVIAGGLTLEASFGAMDAGRKNCLNNAGAAFAPEGIRAEMQKIFAADIAAAKQFNKAASADPASTPAAPASKNAPKGPAQ